jgi:predicted alpha/beta hydrolase family esterase
MKNACIFHCTSCTPESFWYPYLKAFLEEKGYTVWVPSLPSSDKPDLAVQLPYCLDNFKYNEESILIGHSSGCPLILSILENLDCKVKLVVLVAGFTPKLKKDPYSILQKSYDWERIKNNCEHFVFINSDNDPWRCDDKQGRIMFNKLGGDLIIRHGEGHMGSDSFNQPYKEFPLLVNIIKTYL